MTATKRGEEPEKKEEYMTTIKDTELFTTTKQQMRDAREGRPLLPTYVTAKREFGYDGVHRDRGEVFTLEDQPNDRKLWELRYVAEAPESGLVDCSCCQPPREFINEPLAKDHTRRVEEARRVAEAEKEKARMVLWTCPNCRRYLLFVASDATLEGVCPGCRTEVRFDGVAVPTESAHVPEPMSDQDFADRERVLAEI